MVWISCISSTPFPHSYVPIMKSISSWNNLSLLKIWEWSGWTSAISKSLSLESSGFWSGDDTSCVMVGLRRAEELSSLMADWCWSRDCMLLLAAKVSKSVGRLPGALLWLCWNWRPPSNLKGRQGERSFWALALFRPSIWWARSCCNVTLLIEWLLALKSRS